MVLAVFDQGLSCSVGHHEKTTAGYEISTKPKGCYEAILHSFFKRNASSALGKSEKNNSWL